MRVPDPTQQTSSAGFITGLTIGLGICALLLCLGGGAGYAMYRKAYADARKGWNLVPVVVAAVDIPTGTTVTMEMISQRSIPEQFVTASVVKPDSASYVVNQKVNSALLAGDPLLWSQFDPGEGKRPTAPSTPLP